MKLISWNVNNRRDAERQFNAIRDLSPDIVALQEVSASSAKKFTNIFNGYGYSVAETISIHEHDPGKEKSRRLGELIASRWQVIHSDADIGIPWKERVLSACIRHPSRDIRVYIAHIPHGSGHGWIKVDTIEGLYRSVVVAGGDTIVCGDFNAPQDELEDGRVISYGYELIDGQYEIWDTWKGGTGKRWDRGESRFFRDIGRHGMVDVFRHVNGFKVREHSFCDPGGRGCHRFDHIFASSSLKPISCRYLHDLRKTMRLSDHSPIEAQFDI